jgi:hypothetical protein
MRRMIRNVRSGRYFRGGEWTDNPKLAEHFSDSGRLINTCLKHRLRDVELVLEADAGPVRAPDTHVRLFE